MTSFVSGFWDEIFIPRQNFNSTPHETSTRACRSPIEVRPHQKSYAWALTNEARHLYLSNETKEASCLLTRSL